MSGESAEIFDDKSQVRGHLDLTGAQWKLAAPEGVDPAGDYFEVAFVEHTDGVVYAVLRKAQDPEGPVLTYTPQEWDAFLAGAVNDEFDDFLST